MFRLNHVDLIVRKSLRRQFPLEITALNCRSLMTRTTRTSTKRAVLQQKNSPLPLQVFKRQQSIVDGGKPTYQPSDFQKKILVWTKTYKKGEVPDRVSYTQMKNATDKMRVRTSIGLMAFFAVGFFAISVIGKKARKQRQDDHVRSIRGGS